MAVGNLSSVKRPSFAGLDDFRGEWFHTARGPRGGVAFSGRPVAVIGTGSTGIQAIPQIAAQAEQLYVFQGTPNYSMPAQNRPLDPEELWAIRRNYAERRRLAEQSESGVPFPAPTRAAFEVAPSERRRMYEEGWRRGGIDSLS
jgi:cyclohexanone monooxygenase